MTRGRTLKLFLADGSPTGVITAELGNWTGKAVVGPRTALPDIVKRSEAANTGVYVLWGWPEGERRPRVYIGEGDAVRTRLVHHDTDETKEFFTRVCLVVSKDENLTKAHGRYLEARLIAKVKAAGRASLVNGTAPDIVGLPEAEIADMEGFLDEIQVLLPVLGFDVLRPAGGEPVGAAAVEPARETETVFEIPPTTFGAQARAVQRGGEFVVLKDSMARREGVPSWSPTYRDLRDGLVAEGKLVLDASGQLYRFAEDVPFGSTSAAASVVTARAERGPIIWKVAGTKKTYADWRAEVLAGAEGT